jgi:hypothetical protein
MAWACGVARARSNIQRWCVGLTLVAAGAVLVRHWREGVRRLQIALALAGAHFPPAIPRTSGRALVLAVAQAAAIPRRATGRWPVRSSATRVAAGKPATGIPKLAELIGEPAVAVLKRWLGLASAVPLSNTAPLVASSPTWSGSRPCSPSPT